MCARTVVAIGIVYRALANAVHNQLRLRHQLRGFVAIGLPLHVGAGANE